MTEARDFWSRRKARVAEEAEAVEAAAEAQALATEQSEKTDEEILADLGLPDPDKLGEGDDFSGFMAKAVPERLRSRALRKLWLTNPVLANVDGLVDYGEDFTDAACVIDNLQTAYQVGKGMTKHVEEMARQEALEDQDQTEELLAEDAPEQDGPEDSPEIAAAEPAGAAEVAPYDTAETADEPEEIPAPRRRMRFQFDDQDEGLNA